MGDSPSPRVPASAQNLLRGDHLCCLRVNDDEHYRLLTPFLRQGLEREDARRQSLSPKPLPRYHLSSGKVS